MTTTTTTTTTVIVYLFGEILFCFHAMLSPIYIQSIINFADDGATVAIMTKGTTDVSVTQQPQMDITTATGNSCIIVIYSARNCVIL